MDYQTQKKFAKIIGDAAIEAIQSMRREELQSEIARCEEGIREAEDFLKTDEKIQEAKAELKNLEGPSKDTIKALRTRQRVASIVMTGGHE